MVKVDDLELYSRKSNTYSVVYGISTKKKTKETEADLKDAITVIAGKLKVELKPYDVSTYHRL